MPPLYFFLIDVSLSSVRNGMLKQVVKMNCFAFRWCHDIGREQAENKPLLKTVFQIMMCLFSHRKKTLLFVIRDKTKTLEVLEPVLREDIKIWDYVPERPAHKQTPVSEFFNVEVTTLSSYEEKEEQFKEKVILLLVGL